jgi:hypothetical protein
MSQQLLISYGAVAQTNYLEFGEVPFLLIGEGGYASDFTNGGGGEGGHTVETTFDFSTEPVPVLVRSSFTIPNLMLPNLYVGSEFVMDNEYPFAKAGVGSAGGGTVGGRNTNGGIGGNGASTTAQAGGAGYATTFFNELSGTVNLWTLPLTLGLFAGGGSGGHNGTTVQRAPTDSSGQSGGSTNSVSGATTRGTYGTGQGAPRTLPSGVVAAANPANTWRGPGPALISFKVPKNSVSLSGGMLKRGTEADYICFTQRRPYRSYPQTSGSVMYIDRFGEPGNLTLDNIVMRGFGTSAVLGAFPNDSNVFAILAVSFRGTTEPTLTASGWTKYAQWYANSTSDATLAIFYKAYPSGLASNETVTLSHSCIWEFALFTNVSEIKHDVRVGLINSDVIDGDFTEGQYASIPDNPKYLYLAVTDVAATEIIEGRLTALSSGTDDYSIFTNTSASYNADASPHPNQELVMFAFKEKQHVFAANIGSSESSPSGYSSNKVILSIG